MTEAEKGLLEIGYSMATETNFYTLFDTILDACIRYTNADGGTLYMVDYEDEDDEDAAEETSVRLVHLLDRNRTLDAQGEHITASQADMASIITQKTRDLSDSNLFSYTYRNCKMLNIADIYEVKGFDVREIREFDARHSYRTKSILMAPINVKNQKILGVMMLYNSMNEAGEVGPFSRDCERVVASLSAQMANTLTSIMLLEDTEAQLGSFVNSLVTAIDNKTPYNANHTRNVKRYCMKVVDLINAKHTRGDIQDIFIGQNDRDQLSMAALLHDIGKLITPREVLNKATRLGTAYEGLRARLEKIQLLKKIDMLEKRLDPADWSSENLKIENFLNSLDDMNCCDFLTDEVIARVDEIGALVYKTPDGHEIPYLTKEEKDFLHIRKGTLTDEERELVHEHVVYTDLILRDIKFTDKYNKVRRIAACHHEYLDGSGYPNGIKGDELDILTRILTACDIFDSLTADDRPYKKPHDGPSAVNILKKMAKDGQLDERIVGYIEECLVKETPE
ncbi:MAG: HD domain-containing protein [Lachnospiraceae bacterium]|nr:HD domain-containing protein [Lachnospiraceae bacterium]